MKDYFSNIYGERWELLELSMRQPVNKVVITYDFSTENETLQINKFKLSAFRSFTKEDGDISQKRYNGSLIHYVLDPASIVAAAALEPKPETKVLDMCAAPGGKSLLLFQMMRGQGKLICNEISSARKAKLKKVIDNYIPKKLAENVIITQKNGTLSGKTHLNFFDNI